MEQLIVITPEQLKNLIREVLDEYDSDESLPPNNWMNATEAAKYMGVSRGYVHMLKREGLLKCYNPVPGGIVPYSRDQCDAFITRNKVIWHEGN